MPSHTHVDSDPHPACPPRVALRVSAYEQVTSGLMAMLVLAGSLVLLLFLVWIGSQVTLTRVGVPVRQIVIDGEDGGFENGRPNENIELPGEITGQLSQGGPPPEPSFLQALALVSTVVATNQVELTDAKLTEENPWSTGGEGGSRGVGKAPVLGLKGGIKGGVPRQVRWIIDFQEGATLESYARQLDFFQIELGVIGGAGPIEYAFNLSKPTPDKKSGPASQEQRLYFSWQKGALQQIDRQLLAKAGIDPAGKLVVQFYPAETEDLLAEVERVYLNSKFRGRDIKTVRQTRFAVRPDRQGLTFVVTSQTYLGG